jgi:hypothetical protein
MNILRGRIVKRSKRRSLPGQSRGVRVAQKRSAKPHKVAAKLYPLGNKHTTLSLPFLLLLQILLLEYLEQSTLLE